MESSAPESVTTYIIVTIVTHKMNFILVNLMLLSGKWHLLYKDINASARTIYWCASQDALR